MDIKELLQFSFTIVGIKAPWISWVAALGLILWPLYELRIRLHHLQTQNKKATLAAIETINGLIDQFSIRGSQGRDAQVIAYLDKIFDDSQVISFPWNSFKTKLIRREFAGESEEFNDREQVWSSCSAADVYSESISYAKGFNKQRFVAIPGILTGIGLLFTFLAILIGLLDVKILDNKVHGLEGLIGGLSGKFISSIVALFSATIFLFVEKSVFYKMNAVRHSLIDAMDKLFPVRTEAHFLDELCQTMKSQNAAFRTFNSDLSVGLRNNISESMGPILDRVVTAIGELKELTRGSQAELLGVLREAKESEKGEISGKIEELLEDLKVSLSSSIKEMSKEFNKSLTGSAQDQFSNVVEKIGQTAEILSRMNNQFTGTQDALKELIDLSKITTKNQLSEGSAELKKMVNNLDSSMSTIETRFADLSDTMRKSIEGSAEKSSQAADGIITKVGELNQQSVEKFMEVLKKHEGQLDRVDQLKEKLQSAVEEFGTYVTGYNEINAGMRYVAEDVKIAMNSLSSSVQKMKESQDSIKDVAELAASQVKELNTSQELQVETWMNIETSMERYREVFDTVEKSASHVLSDITLHLQQFSSATQDHFNKTVTVANDHVTHAVGQLGAAIDGLSEKLEELGDVAEEISSIKNKLTK
jgi:ABC-type transporter Mla subunit MlaD